MADMAIGRRSICLKKFYRSEKAFTSAYFKIMSDEQILVQQISMPIKSKKRAALIQKENLLFQVEKQKKNWRVVDNLDSIYINKINYIDAYWSRIQVYINIHSELSQERQNSIFFPSDLAIQRLDPSISDYPSLKDSQYFIRKSE